MKNKFYPVDEKFMVGSGGYILPRRATKGSAAYDFYSTESVVLHPGEKHVFYTNVKASMKPDIVLVLAVRSSMGVKFDIVPANIFPIIDGDYFSNESNDGNIIICLKNMGDKPYIVNPGDRIGQGMFLKFETTEDDDTTAVRIGGVGST